MQEAASIIIAEELLSPTLDEILAPVRREFAESGMTEDDLDEFLNGVRQKAWEDRQTRRKVD